MDFEWIAKLIDRKALKNWKNSKNQSETASYEKQKTTSEKSYFCSQTIF